MQMNVNCEECTYILSALITYSHHHPSEITSKEIRKLHDRLLQERNERSKQHMQVTAHSPLRTA